MLLNWGASKFTARRLFSGDDEKVVMGLFDLFLPPKTTDVIRGLSKILHGRTEDIDIFYSAPFIGKLASERMPPGIKIPFTNIELPEGKGHRRKVIRRLEGLKPKKVQPRPYEPSMDLPRDMTPKKIP